MALRCRAVRWLIAALLSAGIPASMSCFALAAEDAGSPPRSPSSDAPAFTLKGSLTLRYSYRTTDLETERVSDQDAFADLRLDVTQPNERQEFHFFGTLRYDIDGHQDQVLYYPLEDIGDTYGRRAIGTVYEAYYALNRPFQPLTKLRAGRQAGTRDEPVFFDGLAADLGNETVNVTVYGGAALHFSEVNWHWGDDKLGGAGIDVTPHRGLTLSADWLAVSDEQKTDPPEETIKDRLAAFKVRQQFDSFVQYTFKYRLLDNEPRDLSLAVQAALPAWDAEMTVRYLRQFREQDELATDVSPFIDVIGRSAPFQSLDLAVRKALSDRLTVDAGYFSRMLLHSADEGPFNKEYRRTFVSADLADLFLSGLSWTVTAERWAAGGTGTNSYGTDLGYRIKRQGRTARFGVGTYYSLYKYDYYTDLGLRDKVRTYYVEAKYPLVRSFSVNGRYEFERGIEEYQTLRLGMRYDF